MIIAPDDSIAFFEQLRELSDRHWAGSSLDHDIFGFQVQPGTTWNPGLSAAELKAFEAAVGFTFPAPLRHFYEVMNGLDKPGVNIYGSSGHTPAYTPVFYAFPNDMDRIQNLLQWIYSANNITAGRLRAEGISRIFPICGHRFMLVDVPGNPVLSMYGSDIIYWTDNISKLIATHIFPELAGKPAFKPTPVPSGIKYWLTP
ncbi:SMI1/KNR4 family protein [Chitinophaga solisilvae]|uniref:SMI1/KNR4 family protein n=1 Tax=Chitinophaga solisilvae TaxID=1233460 RepID=UPI00136B48EF|nr:SMI1/KNR4 family protein [Chitinophaga solisilvae]